jgi:transcriptional regulator with XRE-family HTH domain
MDKIDISDIFADDARKYVKNNLATVRKNKGLSQMQLANLTGCKQSYINKLEQQQANFTPARLITFCRVLDCSYCDLLPAWVPEMDSTNKAIKDNKHIREEIDKIKQIINNI